MPPVVFSQTPSPPCIHVPWIHCSPSVNASAMLLILRWPKILPEAVCILTFVACEAHSLPHLLTLSHYKQSCPLTCNPSFLKTLVSCSNNMLVREINVEECLSLCLYSHTLTHTRMFVFYVCLLKSTKPPLSRGHPAWRGRDKSHEREINLSQECRERETEAGASCMEQESSSWSTTLP